MKKTILVTSIILLLAVAIGVSPKLFEECNFRNTLAQIQNQDGYISVEKQYKFETKTIYIYGILFKNNDRKRPEIIYTTNFQNVTIQWINPAVIGGGGEMINRGRLWIESASTLEDT